MSPRSSSYALQALVWAGSVRAAVNSSSPGLLTDINAIARNWGQIAPYADNAADAFGVKDVGLPDGCQIEQVHTMQRHAHRLPIDWIDDGENILDFVYKLSNWTAAANSSDGFSGPLDFLNSYRYIMPTTGFLTGLGAVEEMRAGVSFWNKYGRTLYSAEDGQLAYDPFYPNGTAREKPLLRTTSQPRMWNSMLNWAIGFFGPTFRADPDQTTPTLGNWTDDFDVLVIPEGGSENNTLAAYDSCFNDYESGIGDLGDSDVFNYIPIYLADATERLQQYAPPGFTFSTNNTYALQAICAYETQYIGQSSFCPLFTAAEWAGFENSLDIIYYYDYAWGNPTGRAQGIGYVQELLARLLNQPIPSSNTSVNATLTSNPTTFPLHRPFYADFSHDDIILSVLTALSLDYFRTPPSLSAADPARAFNLARLTPFAARLVTEVIGCSSPSPAAVAAHRTSYYPEQYGYDPAAAPHKFIRMRLNDGIVPLSSIRGGACAEEGRTDGLCSLGNFVASQADAFERSNYDYACFGNYTVADPTAGVDFDGAIREE